MASLSRLVQDVYALLESGTAKIDSVKLSEMIASRLTETSGGPVLRMSNVGERCHRKLWYREHAPEKAEAIPGHTRLKFIIGDIHGMILPELAKQAGHSVEAIEEEVKFEGVTGHVDCIIDGTIVDVKTANARSMAKFRDHTLERDDPFGYVDQISLYAESLKGDPRVTSPGHGAFLAADKELGHLVLDRYRLPKRDWKSIIASIREALSKAVPPARYYTDEPDGKSGNRQIPMPCRYCSYKKHCWADSNGGTGLRTYIYANGPKWLTRVMKEPKVDENVST